MPAALTGDSYDAQRARLAQLVGDANGNVKIGDTYYPRISNGQGVAIVQAWRRAAARAPQTVARWPWPELLEALLAWDAETGYDVTREHAQAPAPDDVTEWLWSSVFDLAKRLDGGGTVVRSTPIDYSWSAYEQAHRDAYEQRVRDSGVRPASAPATKPGGAFPWWLLAAGLLLFSRKRR